MKPIRRSIWIALLFLGVYTAQANSGYYSRLDKDTLVIGNQWMERKFLWNKGNVMTYSLTDKQAQQTWFNRLKTPDFQITKDAVASNGSYEAKEIKETSIHPNYLAVTISFTTGTLSVKKVYRIYENSPTIACDIYLKGSADFAVDNKVANAADRKNIEFAEDMKSQQLTAIIDQMKLDGFHWQTNIVEFFDVTDWNNNLIQEKKLIPYRKTMYRGNLLLAHNNENNSGFFF